VLTEGVRKWERAVKSEGKAQWKHRAARTPKDTEGRSPQAGRDPGSGRVRISGVRGRQRWSQAERCLARGRYTLHHNILNPFPPSEEPSEGKERTWRVRKGQRSQWSVQRVPGRSLLSGKNHTIHIHSLYTINISSGKSRSRNNINKWAIYNIFTMSKLFLEFFYPFFPWIIICM